MSIFDKECPLCGIGHPLSAERCGCGFSFDPSSLEEAAQKLVLAAQEEELMENYLAARVSQANETFKVVQTRLQADPENNLLVRELEAARTEMESSQAILAEQEEKTDKARKAADAARAAIRQANEAHERRAARRARKEEHHKQAAVAAGRRAEEEALRQAEDAAAAEARARTAAKEKARRAKAEAARKAAEEAERRRQAEAEAARKQTERAERQQRAEQVAKARARAVATQRQQMERARKLAAQAAKDIAAARDRKSRVDGASYRQVAEQVADRIPPAAATAQHHHGASKIALNHAAAISHDATTQFRAVQSEKANAAMALAMRVIEAGDIPRPRPVPQATESTPETLQIQLSTTPAAGHETICPHCTATLAAGANRCGCGYIMDEGDADMPGLSLTEADLAALGTFGQIQITKFG